MSDTSFKAKAVRDLIPGEFIRPNDKWRAYNASCTASFKLNLRKKYEVARYFKEDGWLQLESNVEYSFTTIINIPIDDPDQLVEVVSK